MIVYVHVHTYLRVHMHLYLYLHLHLYRILANYTAKYLKYLFWLLIPFNSFNPLPCNSSSDSAV